MKFSDDALIFLADASVPARVTCIECVSDTISDCRRSSVSQGRVHPNLTTISDDKIQGHTSFDGEL